ncbi:MAG: RnfABCDGE type electron transport complex subunit B [Lachnospiraceae bacterium]|nr:RnfABCDGE type electron transport complex subunit B [Lachnospiraceae bacterium]
MNIMGIVIAAAIVGITGLIIGALLGLAGKAFSVKVDEKEVAIRECLPGNNCGGCGYAGCDALAKAIANGDAPANGCPVGGAPVAAKISEIVGGEVEVVKKVAFVKCSGTCEKAKDRFKYTGNQNCTQVANTVGGGQKACTFGCLGYGECVSVCQFDAIHIVDGIAVVDKEKCVACGKCVATCPKRLIELIPYESKHMVKCNSQDKGKDVKAVCQAGCIGCKMCEKQCESDAIHVENNIAHIDYDKCTGCGKCAEKCPVKIIV